MKKKIRAHEQKDVKTKTQMPKPDSALPAYLLDRGVENRAKVLSNLVKEKRKEKAGKWAVPIPTVKGVAESEIFKVIKTGKKQSKRTSFSLEFILFYVFQFSKAMEKNGHKSHVCR